MRYLFLCVVSLSGCLAFVPRVGSARLSDGSVYVSVSGRGEPAALVARWDSAALKACGGPYAGEPSVASTPGGTHYRAIGRGVVAIPGSERLTVTGRVSCLPPAVVVTAPVAPQ